MPVRAARSFLVRLEGMKNFFGPRLAKRLPEQTRRRTRAAGLRGAKLRPAKAFSRPKFKISCGIKRQARSCRLSWSVWCRARSVRTGSPQPPPGGGLQLASCGSACASPSARLRACLATEIDLEEVGGPQPPPGGGPQLASRRSARAGLSARLRACLATEIDLEEVGGPQPPPAEARSSLASLAYLRRLRPECANSPRTDGSPQLASRRSASIVSSAGCAPKALFVAACVVSSSVRQDRQPAAAPWRRAATRVLRVRLCKPVRSAASLPCD